ncbi:MAG: 3-hydroxyacyl-CoA dehydrogenase family protein [Marmoricola sp.]
MTLPKIVGVYGGGRMGAGIAHAFLQSGTSVIVIENDAASAEAARERLQMSLSRAAEKDRLPGGFDDAIARLTVAIAADELVDAELVIEAVPEDLGIKASVLNKVVAVAPTAVLATNTSSLSVSALAGLLPNPANVIGLHFFNPVPASDLVEIVVGDDTGSALVVEAQGWVADLGKTAITVTDSPGFASSRLGVAIALEAMRMVEEGVATAADIDTAMTLGYRHPTGPLKTTDIVGLDVRLAIAEHLAKEVSPRFEPPQILRAMVAEGKLGRKSGQGFYAW